MRVSTGYGADSGVHSSTTSDIFLGKVSSCYITVSNQYFRHTQQINYLAPHEDKTGDIVERYPELDIAMVQLTPANSCRYTNQMYFQAQAPRCLAEKTDVAPGTWFEVDGMSTGMLSLMYVGNSMRKPVRPLGHSHSVIPVHGWPKRKKSSVFSVRPIRR